MLVVLEFGMWHVSHLKKLGLNFLISNRYIEDLLETHSLIYFFQYILYDLLKFMCISLFWKRISQNGMWDSCDLMDLYKFYLIIKNVLKRV